MSKPEWGSKRVCPGCGVKYYDLSRTPILCPKCGVGFDPDAVLRSRRPKAAPPPKETKLAKPPKPAPAGANGKDAELAGMEEDDDVDLGGLPDDDDDDDDEDDDGSVIEDASELGGEDDDGVGDVVIEKDENREG